MPKKKIETIDVEIRLDLEKELESTSKKSVSVEARTRIDELINEQNIIALSLSKKRKKSQEQEEATERVFEILLDSHNRAIEHNCKPEPISAEKLTELYGSEILLSSLVSKIKSHIKKKYDNSYILTRMNKNKKPAYILVKY